MNELNIRIRHLRKDILGITQEQFSKSIKISRSNLGNIETGSVSITERVISDICQFYNVNREWLENGTGDVFVVSDDETADLVSDLLEEPDNEFYHSILELVRTYKQLSPESRETLREFGKMYLENMKNRKN